MAERLEACSAPKDCHNLDTGYSVYLYECYFRVFVVAMFFYFFYLFYHCYAVESNMSYMFRRASN